MARLSRAQLQERNRARVLAAAREEFAERGFRDAKVDRIAERAELTRGAVYSNFPSKRALYFAVLLREAEQPPDRRRPPTARTAAAVLGDFARAWLARLPLTTEDRRSASRLGRDLLPEIVSDERVSRPFAQLTSLSAILLGLCLEQARTPRRTAPRMVRAAETALTMLHGAGQLAAAAPGFGEPFAVVRACERLAELDLDDAWQPAHLPHVPPARPADEPWSPPAATDALRAEPARLGSDGVLAVLGLHRLAAVEEALRAAPPTAAVTAVLVTGDPGELGPLARLVVTDLRHCLGAAVAPSAWPRLRVVHDESGELAAAAGVSAVSDATEAAVRVEAGRITARAEGYGACHAAASA
ncbi:TetR/AcrR family transcriptional regulator [Saccharothrix algeriensis]|uniref:AcrR family transcriptional regulator n=1 Tax=Saccharothrix algeriensis TaxID=173560 RepID=A0A8T8HXH0_9PSEU|nr:TetR/AcrR family transcriptional regulator [Saccharothrix algeriensis]MBM7814939.1 AcrR family transcriptional regulator [Saccharothrix algeriensis]QTR03206.1 TetR/AcrR family transcriptional regulator [Saccharothrix algeriensis]